MKRNLVHKGKYNKTPQMGIVLLKINLHQLMVLLDYALSNSFFVVGENIIKETSPNGKWEMKNSIVATSYVRDGQPNLIKNCSHIL